MWPGQNLYDAWLLTLPALVPYMVLMSMKMAERKTPFTSETFLNEYDYIVGKYGGGNEWSGFRCAPGAPEARGPTMAAPFGAA